MNCSICDDKINKDDNYIFKNNTYYCLKCNDVLAFLEDDKPKKRIIKKKPEIVISNLYNCIKCNEIYKGSKCNNCNMLNPLFVKKKKKKKKKH
jgi:uncharacterized protein with PIN domain